MEFAVAVNNVMNKIASTGGREMASLVGGGAVGGMGLIAQIRQRIETTGINYKGVKFTGYSTKPILWGYDPKSKGTVSIQNKVYKTLAGSKANRSKLSWVTVKGRRLFEIPGGYKEAKQIFKGSSDFVDFNNTGTLWRSIKVLRFGIEGNKIWATYGPADETNRKILEGLEKKRPDILMPNQKELDLIKSSVSIWMANMIETELRKI